VPDPKTAVIDAINKVIEDRETDDEEVDVTLDSRLYEDLRLDSLEIAELSRMLEEEFGTDPYNEGLAPETVGEVIAFYQG